MGEEIFHSALGIFCLAIVVGFIYGTYRLLKFVYIFSRDLLGKLLGPGVVAGLQTAGTTYLTNAVFGVPIGKLTVPAIVSALCLTLLGYHAKDTSAPTSGPERK